jgi:urease accessory protein
VEIIREPAKDVPPSEPAARILVDRLTLSKRRWRATADDGVDFGFDLATPLTHGTVFNSADGRAYLIEQKPEPVLEITLIPRPAPVARLGWALGNLHFPMQVTDDVIRVPDDTALRQFFERENIPYVALDRVFQPFARAHSHAG